MVKLHYTRSRGRAETSRWMLAVNQIPFENIVIDTPEELVALRATGKLPFDQMPLLEIDGHNLSQSSAMIRYLARHGGFYGDTGTDALWCDLIAGAVADFSETGLKAMFQPTDEIAISGQQLLSPSLRRALKRASRKMALAFAPEHACHSPMLFWWKP
jgi:glutathione S-transferase